MNLVINEKSMRCVWGSTGEYWFSRTDGTVHSSDDLSDNDADLISNGFIPYLTISNEEIIRAYVKTLENKKLSAVFSRLGSDEYVDTFWKYFNAYSEISDGFADFESKYVLDKLKAWCDENGIEYTVEDASPPQI